MSYRISRLLLVLAIITYGPAVVVGAPLNRFVQLGTSGDFANDIYYDLESDTAFLVGDSAGTVTISGEVIGNGAKLFEVGPDGIVTEFLFPDTTFGQAISPNGRFIAVATQVGPEQWNSRIYDRTNLGQPWRSFNDFQAFDVADNGDAVGDFISPETVSPRWATGDGIVELPPPAGSLTLGRAFGISSDSTKIFGSTSRDGDFTALATQWDNLVPNVLPHDQSESGFPTGASPSGQYLTGIDFTEFTLPEGLIFESSLIPVWKDGELFSYMRGVDGEPLRGVDFDGLEFSGGTDITDRGLAIMNTSTGPHAWWPTLHQDRPDLNLAPDQAIPFLQAFPQFESGNTTIIGATAVFADDAGIVHFALDSVIDGVEFAPVYAATDDPTFRPALQAGDANQDRRFDQRDLVQVQIAAKYLTGASATWGEGDWDGAPGGTVGAPPAGDGRFNQRDIIAALTAGKYLTGPYASVAPGGPLQDEQTSIGYNAATGEFWIDTPGLTHDFLQSDLSVVAALADGRALDDVDLIYVAVAEPSSLGLLVLGSFAVIRLVRAKRLSQRGASDEIGD